MNIKPQSAKRNLRHKKNLVAKIWVLITVLLIVALVVLAVTDTKKIHDQNTQISDLQSQASDSSGNNDDLQSKVDDLQQQLDDMTSKYNDLKHAVISDAANREVPLLVSLTKDCGTPTLPPTIDSPDSPAQKTLDKFSACYDAGTGTYIDSFVQDNGG